MACFGLIHFLKLCLTLPHDPTALWGELLERSVCRADSHPWSFCSGPKEAIWSLCDWKKGICCRLVLDLRNCVLAIFAVVVPWTVDVLSKNVLNECILQQRECSSVLCCVWGSLVSEKSGRVGTSPRASGSCETKQEDTRGARWTGILGNTFHSDRMNDLKGQTYVWETNYSQFWTFCIIL